MISPKNSLSGCTITVSLKMRQVITQQYLNMVVKSKINQVNALDGHQQAEKQKITSQKMEMNLLESNGWNVLQVLLELKQIKMLHLLLLLKLISSDNSGLENNGWQIKS